jgi:hypothetical protein
LFLVKVWFKVSTVLLESAAVFEREISPELVLTNGADCAYKLLNGKINKNKKSSILGMANFLEIVDTII